MSGGGYRYPPGHQRQNQRPGGYRYAHAGPQRQNQRPGGGGGGGYRYPPGELPRQNQRGVGGYGNRNPPGRPRHNNPALGYQRQNQNRNIGFNPSLGPQNYNYQPNLQPYPEMYYQENYNEQPYPDMYYQEEENYYQEPNSGQGYYDDEPGEDGSSSSLEVGKFVLKTAARVAVAGLLGI